MLPLIELSDGVSYYIDKRLGEVRDKDIPWKSKEFKELSPEDYDRVEDVLNAHGLASV